MKICNYIYCKNMFDDQLQFCPICGYPVNVSVLENNDFIYESIPELPSDAIIDMHQIFPNRQNVLKDQLNIMEKLNIEKALLQSVPTKVSSIYNNTKLLEVKHAHNDKFLVSHFMDPRHPFARRKLRQYKERGIKVIKLIPALGYEPDNPKFDCFWKTMEELNLIAMIHTGFITARHKKEEYESGVFLNSKFGEPILFDMLARKYPKLQFILCHMGGTIWNEEAIEMINQHENVWGDISGSGIFALNKIITNKLSVNWSKIFWGNDSDPHSYPFNLKLLLHIMNSDKKFSSFLPEILYNNANFFIRKFLL